jgi:hypothetical protein
VRVGDLHVVRLAEVVAQRRIGQTRNPERGPIAPAEHAEDRPVGGLAPRRTDVADNRDRIGTLRQLLEQSLERPHFSVDPGHCYQLPNALSHCALLGDGVKPLRATRDGTNRLPYL